ncbi:MAG: hypothetical protein J6A08_02715 [Lachnospiraceae bacterium]|nr:hypothetical protein [Lachnospiraceae bacterium]
MGIKTITLTLLFVKAMLSLADSTYELMSEPIRMQIMTEENYCGVDEFADLDYYLFCNTQLHKRSTNVHDWENKPVIIGKDTQTIGEAKALYQELKEALPADVKERKDTYVEYVSPDCKWISTVRWLGKGIPDFVAQQKLFYEGNMVKEAKYTLNDNDTYADATIRLVRKGEGYQEMEPADQSKYNALCGEVYSDEAIYDLVLNEEGTLAAGVTWWKEDKEGELTIREIDRGTVVWRMSLQDIRMQAQIIRNRMRDTYLGCPAVIQFQGDEKEGRIVVQGGRSSFYEVAYPSGQITYLGEYLYSFCYSPDGKYAAYSDADYDNGVDMDPEKSDRIPPGIYIREVATGKTAYLYWDPFQNPKESFMECRTFMWIEKDAFDEYMGRNR